MRPRAPVSKSISADTKSSEGFGKICDAVRAATRIGLPASDTNRSPRWMPSAVQAPAGACLGSRRQFDGIHLAEIVVADVGVHVQDAAERAALE